MTTETKHTPGPWKISHGCLPGDSGFSIAADNAECSGNVKITAECWPCTIVSEDHRSELFANARLIAAAPELLEACQSMIEWDDREKDHADTFQHRMMLCELAFIRARAAIANATGEQADG